MKKEKETLHRIREFPLYETTMDASYDVQKTLAEGCFARISLAKHRDTSTEVVLKAIHSELTTPKDFYREFHYSYYLSPHANILCSYDVAFKADNCFVFAQEYAPFGDLAGNVKAGGLAEEQVKFVIQQTASALEFMHSKDLVHRDLKLENILVFSQDLSRIKLCDFGSTMKDGTLVQKTKTWTPFLPPEICEVVENERYHCAPSSDVWQLGIVLYVCMTGCPPWQSADIRDSRYSHFVRWQKRRSMKIPNQFKRFSARLLRLLRRLLDPKEDKRPEIREVEKYLKDDWLDKAFVKQCSVERRESSAYLNDTKQTSVDSKQKLSRLLNGYGLETNMDQKTKSKRVWDWIVSCESSKNYCDKVSFEKVIS